MRMPTRKQKPRKAQVASLPAPTGGLISNRNLAIARSADAPPGAAVLENMFPTATGCILRRGSKRWASVVQDAPVKAIFSYLSGAQREMFAATEYGIWNITTVASPYSFAITSDGEDYIAADVPGEVVFGVDGLEGLDVLTGTTSGDWVVVQFATAGGEFLVGVNGADDAFLYDGTTFDDTAITFPTGSTLTTADLAYVWVYKQRLYFIEKNSLNAWYLPVDQVGGELTLLPLGGVFVRGGVLTWGQSWSLDNGGSGGLSEQCVFTTTEGEVAAYQGLSPDVDQGWTKVGVYRIGRPMGKKAFIRAGGDIVIATTVGFISLASASRQDYAALGQNAVSYPIEDDWARAVQTRGQDDWRCQVWADGQMVLVSPPTPESRSPVVFVSNANTGRWCTFTGWDATAFEVFNGGLFFGGTDGAVRQGGVGGSDEGMPYVGRVLPLFDDMGAAPNLKVMKMAQAVVRSAYDVKTQLSGHVNYKVNFPAPPSQGTIPTGNEWDNGVWGSSTWDAERGDIITGDWVSVGGAGHDVSVGVQITSGAVVPIDAELVRINVTYTLGEVGT
jgi:hypothetical protein